MKRKRKIVKRLDETYESVVLGVLIEEFSFSDKEESGKKIKARLKRKKLGDYDPEYVSRLRKLKDDLQSEIGKQEKSTYYTGSKNEQLRLSKYVEMEDFDIPKLTKDMIARHSEIPKKEIEHFVSHAVFCYHLL